MVGAAMATQQKVCEEIAYMKLWLGVFLVTMISLGGWIMTRGAQAGAMLLYGSVIAFLALFVMCALLHFRIKLEIDGLEEK